MRQVLFTLFLALASCPLRAQSSDLGKLDWKLHEPAPVVYGAVYAVDPVRKRLVRFGGERSGVIPQLTDETWEFDGSSWRRLHPRVSPPPIARASMAFDPNRQTLILFGGLSKDVNGVTRYLDQTWEWDGQEWRRLISRRSPAPRFALGGEMVTQFKHNQIVLFTTYRGNSKLPPESQTWVWQGSEWKELRLTVQPSPRFASGVGYHPGSGKVILHGGSKATVGMLQDTWEFDGSAWKQLSFDPKNPEASPGIRCGMEMAADPANGDLLCFGGAQLFGTTVMDMDDLWAFDGKAWKRRLSTTWLIFQKQKIGSFRALANKLYMVSSSGNDLSTLVFTGTIWNTVTTWSPTLPSQSGFELVHDPGSGQTYLMGSPDPGGYSKNPPAPEPIEVYRYSDDRVEKVLTKVRPPCGGRFVYHRGLGKVLYFDNGTYSQDPRVWYFDGQDWTKGESWVWTMPGNMPVNTPTYLPRNGNVVVVALGKTWGWTPWAGWSVIAEHKDNPRALSIAYDTTRKKLIGYGAKDSTAYTYNQFDTWEWDDNAWTKIQTKTRPGPVYRGYRLTDVPELGGVVLTLETARPLPMRPTANDPAITTWLYDGTDWKQLDVEALPAGQGIWLNNIAYDAARQRLLLIYGSSIYGLTRELSVTTLAASQPLPRPGEALSFEILLPQAANRAFVLCLSQARSPGIPMRQDPGIGLRVLPLAPDQVFQWSLSGPIVTVLDAQGRGSIPFRIPNDSGLSGLDLWAAGFTLTPGLGIGAITNPAPLQIIR